MSAKETDLRKKAEAEDPGEDVVAHGFVTDEIADDDPERKRKRKVSEEPGGDGFERKRK